MDTVTKAVCHGSRGVSSHPPLPGHRLVVPRPLSWHPGSDLCDRPVTWFMFTLPSSAGSHEGRGSHAPGMPRRFISLAGLSLRSARRDPTRSSISSPARPPQTQTAPGDTRRSRPTPLARGHAYLKSISSTVTLGPGTKQAVLRPASLFRLTIKHLYSILYTSFIELVMKFPQCTVCIMACSLTWQANKQLEAHLSME